MISACTADEMKALAVDSLRAWADALGTLDVKSVSVDRAISLENSTIDKIATVVTISVVFVQDVGVVPSHAGPRLDAKP